MTMTDLDYLLRLLLAAGCGMFIGLERQYRSRTAGLRTQALVAVGAAAFVLFGIQVGTPQAPLQIAAYVVSGVGFLGGGVILRQGFAVQGLNTAATLWCSAAVGCQAAGGHVIPALVTTGVVLTIHVLLRPLGRLVDRAPAGKTDTIGAYVITVLVEDEKEPELRTQLSEILASPDVIVQAMSSHLEGVTEKDHELSRLNAEVLIEGNASALLDAAVTQLSLEPRIREVSWRSEDPEPVPIQSLENSGRLGGVRSLWKRRGDA